MEIKIEGITQGDGSELFDLVLVQGEMQIRLGLTAPNETRAATELAVWLEDNTIDIVEIVRAKGTSDRAWKEGGGMRCLSIRQPWAWLIVHGWKNVENRTWFTKYRGQLLIHASSNMTRADYEACRIFVAGIHEDMTIPTFEVLPRGGIVGKVTLLDCVRDHHSPWFTGPVGWVIDDACACTLVPCGGRQGLFEVRCKWAITGVGK